MANGLPLDPYGDVVSNITLGSRRYTYRLYYTDGPCPGWLLDLADISGETLATGVRITAGTVNMLVGYAGAFVNVEALPITDLTNYAERNQDAPDSTMFVNWYPDGEQSGVSVGDAMENLSLVYEILTGPNVGRAVTTW